MEPASCFRSAPLPSGKNTNRGCRSPKGSGVGVGSVGLLPMAADVRNSIVDVTWSGCACSCVGGDRARQDCCSHAGPHALSQARIRVRTLPFCCPLTAAKAGKERQSPAQDETEKPPDSSWGDVRSGTAQQKGGKVRRASFFPPLQKPRRKYPNGHWLRDS